MRRLISSQLSTHQPLLFEVEIGRGEGLMYAIVANVMVENPDEARLLLPEAREALVSRARAS
jgi:hypothetical protein